MPRALQAKEAREMDKKAVLGKNRQSLCLRQHLISLFHSARSFEKWLQVYRTKVALRAVA
jgi:hypothetical protein